MKYFVKVGEKYARLTVLATHQRYGDKRQFYNLCQCACGNKTYRTSAELVRGIYKSCGCAHRERQKRGNFIHGGTTARANGKVSLPYLYGFWWRPGSRCHTPEDPLYPKHGGRGIALAEHWREDYPAFRDYVEEHLG